MSFLVLRKLGKEVLQNTCLAGMRGSIVKILLVGMVLHFWLCAFLVYTELVAVDFNSPPSGFGASFS